MTVHTNPGRHDQWIDPMTFIDRHKDEPIVIMGAAPSLNDIDLSLLEDTTTIGISWTLMLPYPVDYLLVSDHAVIESQAHSFNESEAIGLFRESTLTPKVPIERSFTTWKWRDGPINGVRGTYGLTPTPQHEMSCAGNSSYYALQWALWMGADPIIFIGVDVDLTPRTKTQYQEEVRKANRKTHFWGYGFQPSRGIRAVSAYYGFSTMELFRCFSVASIELKRRGVKVINSSTNPESKLTMFERMPLAEALEIKNAV